MKKIDWLPLYAIIVSTIVLIFSFCVARAQGLEVDPFDNNYLTWNGERTLLIGETPNTLKNGVYSKSARVAQFDTSYFKRAKAYGVNHTFVSIADLYEGVDPRTLPYVASNSAYWTKLALIAKTAKQHNMILGVVIFSYSTFYSTGFKNAFEKQYEWYGICSTYLDHGIGFFDLSSNDSTIKEVINIERTIMEQVAKAVWLYAGYICPMWESGAKRALAVRGHEAWHKDFVTRMKNYGQEYYPSIKSPLFAIEMKLTVAQLRSWGYDMFVDEDGNTPTKRDVLGAPAIQWSSDRYSRGVDPGWPAMPYWNNNDADQWTGVCPGGDCEPVHEPTMKFMQWCVDNGWAGIASSWGADKIEQTELKRINDAYNFSFIPLDTIPIPPIPLDTISEPININISGISVANCKSYEIDELQIGKKLYLDRTYYFMVIPEELKDSKYIKAINDDKLVTCPSKFLCADIDTTATLYVAYDSRLGIPSWLSFYTNTGKVIKCDQPEGKNAFNLYSKTVSKGTHCLGPCYGNSKSNMYFIIIKQRK